MNFSLNFTKIKLQLTTINVKWTYVLWSLATYLAFVLNSPVLLRRLSQLLQENNFSTSLFYLVSEMVLLISFTILILSLARCLGIWLFRLITILLLFFSALSCYYMNFFNVVIGYGIVQSVLTTDIDLSKESFGWSVIFWVFITMLPGLIILYFYRVKSAVTKPILIIKNIKNNLLVISVIFLGVLSYYHLNNFNAASGKSSNIKPAVLTAHSYVPSNWLAGLGMWLSNLWHIAQQNRNLLNPSNLYDYQFSTPINNSIVVIVIGESVRSSNLNIFGYQRLTTPYLSNNQEWAIFPGKSCNTSTKLSLQCMFVRPSAVKDNGFKPPKISEMPVFSVFKKLGYNIQLFSMQSEVWFYNSIFANHYKIREIIAADPKNSNRPSHDNLLLNEVEETIKSKRKEKLLIILHTKGSHFLYSSRYPGNFAQYQPECLNIENKCSEQQLINSYDNSILYLDNFLANLTKILSNENALLLYTSDHGESISNKLHFHATPKPIAPPEQLAVPLLLWASPAYLANPVLAKGFAAAQAKSHITSKSQSTEKLTTFGHDNLFDSLLGCLGITSHNGGVNDSLNLCH